MLLDELNLAPADVLEVLCGLMSSDPHRGFATRNGRLCRRGTLIAATMNPVSGGGGRRELPPTLRRLLVCVHLLALSKDEARARVRDDTHTHTHI